MGNIGEATAGPSGITDVAGIRVGQIERIGDGWLTGVTVIVPPPGSPAAVSVRGAAPATHQTDALHTGAVAPTPDAIVLTGGSSLGLITAHGVARRLCEAGRGYPVGDSAGEVLPLVPAAAIYDVGRGGEFASIPNEEMGYQAAERALAAADHAPVTRGNVGAGAGAAILDERFKGGVGTGSVVIEVGGVSITLGALAVVNAFGGPVGRHGEPVAPSTGLPHPGYPPSSTVLAVVATDADLDLGTLWQTADAAHDGLARQLDPVHTLADGDTIFAVSTRQVEVPGSAQRFDAPRAWRDAMIGIQAAAARVVADAVADGIRAAEAVVTPAFTFETFDPSGFSAPDGRGASGVQHV